MPTLTDSQSPTFFLSRGESAASCAAVQGEREMLEVGGLPPEGALTRQGTNDKGLEPGQIEERRAQYGANVVESGKRHGILSQIASRFKNPLVIQLLVICGVSAATGDVPSA